MKQDKKTGDRYNYGKFNACGKRKNIQTTGGLSVARNTARIISGRKKIAKSKLIIKTDAPKQHVSGLQQHIIKPDLTHATISSAESGAVIAIVTATFAIMVSWWRGQVSLAEAGKLIFREAFQGGAKSATTNVVSLGAKHALFRNGAVHLARSHAPVAIAATCIAASTAICTDIKKCRKGEMKKGKVATNALLHISRSAFKTCITIATGGIGGIVGAKYGQIGTVIGATLGATVGYIGSIKIINLITVLVSKTILGTRHSLLPEKIEQDQIL